MADRTPDPAPRPRHRRLLVALLLVLAVLVVAVAVEVIHVLVAGPFHPPTDGGYWGGIFLHRLWPSS